MKRRIITLVFLLCLFLGIFPSSVLASTSVSGICGENLYWNFDENSGTLTITGYGNMTNYESDLKVPWFSYKASRIKYIMLPDGLTSIGSYAFDGCQKLQNISIPNGVTKIWNHAFSACSALTDVTLPPNIRLIGSWAFNNCKNLYSIRIPYGVEHLSFTSFRGCSNLSSIILPDSITSIGDWALYHCPSLKSIIIPKSVSSIGKNALGMYDNKGKVDSYEGFTIYGYAETAAETYSREYGHKFIPLDSKESFNEFFTRTKLQNIHELCDYESIGYAILQSSSSFQINWNTCIQAFCNKDFIDLSKLKFQPQYYYETVLLQSIAKTKLNDDYLEALASEAKNLLIDAADVFLTLDSDLNSYDDLYETKLNEATDLFGGTSPEVHKLYKAYGKYTSAENFYDDVKFVYDSYKEINGTCGDFLTALNNYEISQSVSAELILALEYVRDSIQTEASKENQYLVKAIDEVLKQTRQSRDASMKDFIGKTAKEQVLGFVISVAKDIVSPIATGFDLESVGADTVITISDTLFPTSMSSDSCCKIYADYAFEYVYQEALNRALSSNDESKAAIVVGLYDLLSNTYMHEIEVAKILASQIYKDGLINCLRNLFSYKSDYKYVTECIQAYKADLYAITKERTAALTEYGFAVGLQQPITVVCYQNGKVIYYHETSVPTGTCYKPEVDTERFAQMLGMNVDINAFYTDSALTIMYDSTRSVNAPLTLFCNVSLSARNSSEMQMVDYSTGIVVANHSEADSTMLRTQQMLSGSTYDSISSNLGTENFSLYDITMTRQNSPIQPSTQVQVKIPLLINDAQKVGKVYRVENGQFSDMKSYIEDDYYCFNTTHFSEYVVSLIPITSKEESCENDPNRCPSIIFTDAPSYGNWAHAGIDYCVSHGLMNGVGKGQFDPNGTLTRAMLVTVLYRVQGEPDVSGLENPFEDVPDGMWYTEPIIWAASKQVVNGTSAATFEPDAPITREQIAAILYRYAKEVEGADVSASAALDGFADAASVSAYARTPLGWASALGYIKGSNENGTLLLNPQGNATRAEVATILMRYLER